MLLVNGFNPHSQAHVNADTSARFFPHASSLIFGVEK